MAIKLVAVDDLGRVHAESFWTLERTVNPVTESPTKSYKLLNGGFGHDFGTLRYFASLPIGQSWGIVAKGPRWSKLDN